MAKMNIKKGDKVLVITGKDTGKTAEVLSCFPEENKVTVKGLNIIVKHNKPKSAQDKGGIVKKEGKIPASNVMVVCPSCDKATRIAHAISENGNKTRTCKHCGANLDNAKKATKKSTAKAEAKPTTAKVETKKAETKTTAKKETATETKTVKSAEVKAETKSTAKVEKTDAKAEVKEVKSTSTKKVEKAEPAKKVEDKKTTTKSADKKTTSTAKSAK